MKASSFFSRLRAITANSPITLVHQAPANFSRAFVLAFAMFIAATNTPTASAQTVTYAGSGAVNFGSVNVCPSGKTTPAPCSETLTLTYNVTASGTLGTPKALTTGDPNLDYKLASGSTCAGSVEKGSTCTVNVIFAPIAPGARNGAVEIVDASGKALATTLIYGTGVGPLAGFTPQAPRTILTGFNFGVAVDARGNVFIAGGSIQEVLAVDGSIPTNPVVRTLSNIGGNCIAIDGAGNVFFVLGELYEILAADGYTTTRDIANTGSTAIAIDGSGNVFVNNNASLYEYFASDNYATYKELDSQYSSYGVTSLAVDASGNLFAPSPNNDLVLELSAAGGYSTIRTIDVASVGSPQTVAVDPAGNLFIGFPRGVWEALAVDGAVPTYPTFLPLAPFGRSQHPIGTILDGRGNVYIATNIEPVLAVAGEVQELSLSTPEALSFVATEVGSISFDSPKSVQIQNHGNATLDATAFSVSPDWDQVPGSGTPADCAESFSLAPSAQCNASISFEPTEPGALTGTATFVDNSLNAPGSAQSIRLSGTAIAVAPHITSVNTTYAAPYSVVILDGTNFGATQGASIVTFNGIPTPHYYWTDSKIYVTVPPTGTTGYVIVFVDGQPSNAILFTVLPMPTVTGISPTSGPVGTVVSISGTNLLDYGNGGTVTFDGKTLPIVSQTGTAIKVAIPTGAVTERFHVLVNDTGINTSTFTVTQ